MLRRNKNKIKPVEFKPITAEIVPSTVVARLIQRAGLHVKPGEAPQDIEEFDSITASNPHANGDVTYTARHIKNYSYGDSEITTQFVDSDPEGKISGIGEVRYNPNPTMAPGFFKDKPFVGWTYTEENGRRAGLGRRRLLTMAQYARNETGYALHSDTLQAGGASRIWGRLVKEGLAEKYSQDGNPRYKMKQ